MELLRTPLRRAVNSTIIGRSQNVKQWGRVADGACGVFGWCSCCRLEESKMSMPQGVIVFPHFFLKGGPTMLSVIKNMQMHSSCIDIQWNFIITFSFL